MSSRQRTLSFAVFIFSLLIYLVIPTKDYYWDGVGFALTIEQAGKNLSSLFHPNHLLYDWLGYFVWRGLSAIHISIRALYVLQAMNAVFAAATVYLVWKILLKTTPSTQNATALAALFAFSARWWKFATNADAYIPSIFFLTLAFWLLLPSKRARPVLVAVVYSAAVLLHQLAVFFFPVAILCFWRQQPDKRTRFTALLQYSATAGILTTVSYAAAYAACSDGSIWDWITTHSQNSSFSSNLPRAISLTLKGTLRLVFGGRSSLLNTNVVTVAGVVVFGILLVLFLWSLARRDRLNRPDLASACARVLKQKRLLAWITVYILFLLFWLPQNTFYRLFYLPPLIFLFGTAYKEKPIASRTLPLFVSLVFVWNFTFFIYPHSRTENNEVLDFSLHNRVHWPENTVIAYRVFHSDLWTISYFNPQVSWRSCAGDVRCIEKLRTETSVKGEPLWLERTVYDELSTTNPGKNWLRENIEQDRSLIQTSPTHAFGFYRVRR